MMMTFNETLGLECRTADTYRSFGAYLDAQTELFVESMQDAADNQWHSAQFRMEGASEEEIGAEMERWWNRQVRRFPTRLRQEHEEGRWKRLKRRLHRESRRRLESQKQLETTQVELQQAKDDLMIERGLTDYLKEQWRCRNCSARWWD